MKLYHRPSFNDDDCKLNVLNVVVPAVSSGLVACAVDVCLLIDDM